MDTCYLKFLKILRKPLRRRTGRTMFIFFSKFTLAILLKREKRESGNKEREIHENFIAENLALQGY